MSKLFNTTLRINLSDPEGLKAWTYLVNRVSPSIAPIVTPSSPP